MVLFRCGAALKVLARRALFPGHSIGKRTITMASGDKKEDRLVWVDCEMTGLDPEKDVLLEIAVLVTDSQLEIVAEGPDIVIHQADSVLDSMGEWCKDTHGRSGLTRAVRDSTVDVAACQTIVLDFLRQHTLVGKCPLAGNSVGQDARFLNRYMPDLMAHLHYRIVDVSTVKELARRWYPDVVARAPPKSGSHRALDDIKESIAELKFYRQNVFK